jgi:hypothetical protein
VENDFLFIGYNSFLVSTPYNSYGPEARYVVYALHRGYWHSAECLCSFRALPSYNHLEFEWVFTGRKVRDILMDAEKKYKGLGKCLVKTFIPGMI